MRHKQLKTKSNPKYFFTYARKKLKTRSKIGPFDIEGEKFTSLLDICVKLVQQYSSSFSKPDPRYKIENSEEFFSINEDSAEPILDDIDFTRKSIIDAEARRSSGLHLLVGSVLMQA